MVTMEERKKILDMLHNGQISPEAAAQLLSAVESEGPEAPAAPDAPAAPTSAVSPDGDSMTSVKKPRWLRVRVSDSSSNRPKVNVRLPITLVGMGLKLGARYSPELEGIDVAELMAAAESMGTGPFVDVYDDEDGEHVEIFLE